MAKTVFRNEYDDTRRDEELVQRAWEQDKKDWSWKEGPGKIEGNEIDKFASHGLTINPLCSLYDLAMYFGVIVWEENEGLAKTT